MLALWKEDNFDSNFNSMSSLNPFIIRETITNKPIDKNIKNIFNKTV